MPSVRLSADRTCRVRPRYGPRMETTTANGTLAEPFLKWAGGKRVLLPQILDVVPTPVSGRYFEPFLGGGALFFALGPNQARLSDLNGELMATYRAVRDHVDEVIEVLATLRNAQDDYYRIRAWNPRTPARRAARFIYLNKTCFNGLYRENLFGQFNVPYGRHKYNTVVCDTEQLTTASQALQSTELRTLDFVDAVRPSTRGDLVYFDPPYITGHQNNGFIEYNARIFSWSDQRRLRAAALRLMDRGVKVVISNADHPSIRALYEESKRFAIHTLNRWSTMASRSSRRYMTDELLIVSREA
jgi:DNA adenine methylase